MTYIPFTVKMTEDQITDKLRSLYGTEFTTADIKAFCSMNEFTTIQLLENYRNTKYPKVSGILK